VVDQGLTSRIVVRFAGAGDVPRERLAALAVTTSDGRLIALDDVADLRFDLGPSMVRRENVQRVAMLTANVAGADLAGTVERAQAVVAGAVDLPTGYLVTFGGPFEEASRGVRNLAVLGALILAGMYGVLYLAFRSHRETLVVLVNLPLALIGGIFAVILADGVLSIATLVGFVTLFGIATRNGVLLVTHYQHLMREEGLDVAAAVRRGSRERLAPILMTALTAGLALIPLVLQGDQPGNEIQSPMALVILGGLISSTFLNLVVVPALYQPRRPARRAAAEFDLAVPIHSATKE
jgi:Cu/Ag efflux pump CusA